MSNVSLEIINTSHSIEIQTSTENVENIIELQNVEPSIIEINPGFAGSTLFASDIVGLSTFIDNLNLTVDGGTP